MIFIDPKLWAVSSGKPLGDFSEGDIIQLNEGGVPVDFYVAKHNYESALNGAGKTLVVRKDAYNQMKWNSTGVNAYATSDIDKFLNSNYKALFDSKTQESMDTTKFYYTPGAGNTNVEILERSIFCLSAKEITKVVNTNTTPVEGSVLPIASKLSIAYFGADAVSQWLRTPRIDGDFANSDVVIYIFYLGNSMGAKVTASNIYSRPAFTLPSDFRI